MNPVTNTVKHLRYWAGELIWWLACQSHDAGRWLHRKLVLLALRVQG